MQIPSQESAMTEVALALAMGFFSLMVLTLISMGVDGAVTSGSESATRPAVLDLAPPAQAGSAAATAPEADDIVVIFDGREFLDTNLAALEPATVARTSLALSRRVILAVDPALSLERTLALRERLKTPHLVVTAFGPQWRDRLAQQKEGNDAP